MKTTARLTLSLISAYLLSGCAPLPPFGGVNYPFPNAELPAAAVCGQSRCQAGNDGVPFQFTKKIYAPEVNESTTPADVAYQLLGYTMDNPYGHTPFTCASNVSPFQRSDISELTSTGGLKVEYTRAEVLDIDVKAAVDADVKALLAAQGVTPAVPIDDLKASLTAAYQSLNKSNVTVSATYHEFALTQEAYRDVFQRKKHEECARIIASGKEKLITGIGLVWFNLDYESASAGKLIADLQTRLETQGVKFNVGAAIRRTVNASLKSSLKQGYLVPTWTTADQSHFRKA